MLFSLAVLCGLIAPASALTVTQRPSFLYSFSPKLRIQTEESVFQNVFPEDIKLSFTPTVKASSYNVSILSDTVIVLSLNPGKKWSNPSTVDGMTLYLMEIKMGEYGANQLEDAVQIATIIPTPTVNRNTNNVIYISGSTRLVINGTNFRSKYMELQFEPPLVKDVDYILTVRSSTSLLLTRTFTSVWRNDPGPLKLRRINTGAGFLGVGPNDGGITVAVVQMNLGAHGVTVQSTPDKKIYQSSKGPVQISGQGFSSDQLNVLRWANGLRGKGVNYTTVQASSSSLSLELKQGSKWRANGQNLPGPLMLLAVDAGAGFIPVGPTEAKKGRIVATVFEDPHVRPNSKVLYQTHSHQVWIVGSGFTRNQYSTVVTFSPNLVNGEDISVIVHNRTHILVSLFNGKKWSEASGPLKVVSIDSGAGPFALPNGGVTIGTIESDAEDHPSGVTIERSTQTLYQTAVLRKLIITGRELTEETVLTFDPPLVKGEDYTQRFDSSTKLTLSLVKNAKWHYYGGSLMVTSVNVGKGPIELAHGQGIQVANIQPDPTIDESARIVFASHTKKLIVMGSGFSIEGTELTLSPTRRSDYEVERIESNEIVLALNEDSTWADVSEGESQIITVLKVDTGAGEVTMKGDGVVVAKVESDLDDNNCEDSCEWALDGVCDDGSGSDRFWFDDDYGGYYGMDDYYGYGGFYGYYMEDDDFLSAVCEEGTDCSDCGGPATSDVEPVTCENTCQWVNDGYCDDTRTSGLCPAGTDCHDCGPLDASNFTTFDDDGWWDDDDYYWDMDDTFEYARYTKSKPAKMNDGAGSIFLSVLESIVLVVGAAICSVGGYLGFKWYKGQDIAYTLAPTEDVEMTKSTVSSVPITPDNFHT